MPEHVTGFVLPLATAMFHIAGPVSWTMGALFVGWFYNVPLHATQLATIAFAAVFLGFASPGIPRGAFIMLTPLLLAVGLPAEGVGRLIAADAIPDTFSTVMNVTGIWRRPRRWREGNHDRLECFFTRSMAGAVPVQGRAAMSRQVFTPHVRRGSFSDRTRRGS
jgi:hypothetical protein